MKEGRKYDSSLLHIRNYLGMETDSDNEFEYSDLDSDTSYDGSPPSKASFMPK